MADRIAPAMRPKVRTTFRMAAPGWGRPSLAYAAAPRVTRRDDFGCFAGKSYEGGTLRDEPELPGALNRLGAPAGAQLVEDPAQVGLHGVLAHEGPCGDLAVAEPDGH